MVPTVNVYCALEWDYSHETKADITKVKFLVHSCCHSLWIALCKSVGKELKATSFRRRLRAMWAPVLRNWMKRKSWNKKGLEILECFWGPSSKLLEMSGDWIQHQFRLLTYFWWVINEENSRNWTFSDEAIEVWSKNSYKTGTEFLPIQAIGFHVSLYTAEWRSALKVKVMSKGYGIGEVEVFLLHNDEGHNCRVLIFWFLLVSLCTCVHNTVKLINAECSTVTPITGKLNNGGREIK